jgi:hypothetical protein
VTSVESIREGFPFITIAKQPGLPTHETIAEVHLKLKANAASVVSKLGGGAHGLLGLVLPPATYAALTNVAFNTPLIPGQHPTLKPEGLPPKSTKPSDSTKKTFVSGVNTMPPAKLFNSSSSTHSTNLTSAAYAIGTQATTTFPPCTFSLTST